MSKKKQKLPKFEETPWPGMRDAVAIATNIEFSGPAQTDVMSELDRWAYDGVPCHYARFHHPVPPYVNKEPVSEFKVKSDAEKYKVDSIVYTPYGVIWTANGETDVVPLANVIYVRTITS
jgi:hypothetical protein